jgi:hypothetical protein
MMSLDPQLLGDGTNVNVKVPRDSSIKSKEGTKELIEALTTTAKLRVEE